MLKVKISTIMSLNGREDFSFMQNVMIAKKNLNFVKRYVSSGGHLCIKYEEINI